MTDLDNILQEINEHSTNFNRRALSQALRHVMENRREYYKKSVEAERLDEFTDALYKILLLEIDEEEEDSIETAELAYLGICFLLKQKTDITPDYYKRRMLLLHYFSDYFTDAIIEVLLKKYQQEHLLQARSLAIECIEKMQLADIFYLEEHEPDFIDKDEQLTDACNNISINPNLSDEEHQEAVLLHKIMYAYLSAKYKN